MITIQIKGKQKMARMLGVRTWLWGNLEGHSLDIEVMDIWEVRLRPPPALVALVNAGRVYSDASSQTSLLKSATSPSLRTGLPKKQRNHCVADIASGLRQLRLRSRVPKHERM